MNVTINIPGALRRFVDNRDHVVVNATTAAEALAELARVHPGLAANILTPDGKLRSYIRVFCNDKDIHYLDAATIQMAPGDALTLVAAIAGG